MSIESTSGSEMVSDLSLLKILPKCISEAPCAFAHQNEPRIDLSCEGSEVSLWSQNCSGSLYSVK